MRREVGGLKTVFFLCLFVTSVFNLLEEGAVIFDFRNAECGCLASNRHYKAVVLNLKFLHLALVVASNSETCNCLCSRIYLACGSLQVVCFAIDLSDGFDNASWLYCSS